MKCDNRMLNKYIIKIADGNLQEFEAFYNYTEKLIYAYIVSITGNPESSEDIKQDTYVKIFQNAGKYNPNTNALAWIVQIAKNTALSAICNGNKNPLLFSGSEDEINKISVFPNTDQIENKSLFEYITSALDENCSEIIMLHLYSGYTLKEIAPMLELPLTTVHWRYRTALNKLKAHFKKGDFEL